MKTEPNLSSLLPANPAGSASVAPILLADDDPDDLFFAIRLIKKTGTVHPTIAFDDGSGVVDYLTRAWLGGSDAALPPRLLFLDLKMTGLGGFDFLKWVAGEPKLSALHVVVLSASNDPGDIEKARMLGAKRYLAKHPSVATFARIIQHAYGTSALTDGFPAGRQADPFAEPAVFDGTRSRNL